MSHADHDLLPEEPTLWRDWWGHGFGNVRRVNLYHCMHTITWSTRNCKHLNYPLPPLTAGSTFQRPQWSERVILGSGRVTRILSIREVRCRSSVIGVRWLSLLIHRVGHWRKCGANRVDECGWRSGREVWIAKGRTPSLYNYGVLHQVISAPAWNPYPTRSTFENPRFCALSGKA